MLCYEAAEWATLSPHVRGEIASRLTGYQKIFATTATDRERYWPKLDDAEWAVLSELTETLANLCSDAVVHLCALNRVERRGH
jgi:hypothetical protein